MESSKNKGYNFVEVESKIKDFWEKEQIYKFDSKSTTKKVFSFDTPPYTISGRLHMGHAFGDAQQDFIARYKRMNGFNVFNPFGTDDNGLPTLRLVEKEKDVDSRKMNRKDFISLCLKTIKEEFVPLFLQDAKNLGLSANWELSYSTIDENSQRISQKSFIDLYNTGREYRQDAPALWCTQCQTTIAQVELEDTPLTTTFNDIIFKVGKNDLIVSTTRPELLPACVSIFVNPSDERYKNLVGSKAKVPLFDFEVPILSDEKANPEKGTGVVMCCTFGDQTDMEWQKEHHLEIKEAISPDGKMTKIAGEFEGLKIFEARKKIIERLRENNLLKSQKEVTHEVNVHERCGTPIEFIHKKQWFVKYLDLKDDMLKWGSAVNWFPKHMMHRYNNWVEGLKWDWCISRQISFGIPFPVWYCKDCENVVLAREEDLPVDPTEDKPPVDTCQKCGCKDFVPETDIMNTWATSALTPTIAKELLKGTSVYEVIKNNPMSLRRNGHDIITFWDFNTIVKSQLHYKMNPWDDLMINGWILGRDGKKMSKSRKNGMAPQEIMKEWGSDVLRYFCAVSKLGDDVILPEKELVAGKKLVNKLINASKFVFMNLEGYDGKRKPEHFEFIDFLFFQKLESLIEEATEAFEEYEYSKVKLAVEHFFFKDFTDNYLEIVKKRIYNESGDRLLSAQWTLYQTLLTVLKLFAPIMPFVTEHIYQEHFRSLEGDTSIHISSWPKTNRDIDTSNRFDIFKDMLSQVREEKTSKKKSLNAPIILTIPKEHPFTKLEGVTQDLMDVTNAQEIKEGSFKVEFV